MRVRLIALGRQDGPVVLPEGRSIIGRTSDSDFQILDGRVSRFHCQLFVSENRVTIEDLGSYNGTFVNGQPVTAPRSLTEGDVIRVGRHFYEVHLERGESVAEPDRDAARERLERMQTRLKQIARELVALHYGEFHRPESFYSKKEALQAEAAALKKEIARERRDLKDHQHRAWPKDAE